MQRICLCNIYFQKALILQIAFFAWEQRSNLKFVEYWTWCVHKFPQISGWCLWGWKRSWNRGSPSSSTHLVIRYFLLHHRGIVQILLPYIPARLPLSRSRNGLPVIALRGDLCLLQQGIHVHTILTSQYETSLYSQSCYSEVVFRMKLAHRVEIPVAYHISYSRNVFCPCNNLLTLFKPKDTMQDEHILVLCVEGHIMCSKQFRMLKFTSHCGVVRAGPSL